MWGANTVPGGFDSHVLPPFFYVLVPMTGEAQFITFIILATLMGSYLVQGLADLLNLRNLNTPLPQEFHSTYDSKKYADSQNYLKATTRFGFLTSSVHLVILLVFWFSGGFPYIDGIVRSLGLPSILPGLVYIGILLGLKLLISLPFNIYSTFVIEEKFGFNKTTPRLFILDLLKSILLSSILGGILLSLVLVFLEFTGPYAWILCWISGIVFLLIVQYIVPVLILPLFNTFSPLENGPLKESITQYADSIQFSISNIFVMDGSKRSNKSNAFFTGFGKNKRIVLFDTLIKEQTTEELVAVLAHEMGHYKKRHILKRMVLGILQMGLIFYLLSLALSHGGLFQAFFMEEPSVYAGLVFFGMLYAPVDLFLSMLLQISSRKDEYEADQFAKETLKDGKPLISALKKLSVHNLSNLTPHPFYVFLNYSHPPLCERIAALKAL